MGVYPHRRTFLKKVAKANLPCEIRRRIHARQRGDAGQSKKQQGQETCRLVYRRCRKKTTVADSGALYERQTIQTHSFLLAARRRFFHELPPDIAGEMQLLQNIFRDQKILSETLAIFLYPGSRVDHIAQVEYLFFEFAHPCHDDGASVHACFELRVKPVFFFILLPQFIHQRLHQEKTTDHVMAGNRWQQENKCISCIGA